MQLWRVFHCMHAFLDISLTFSLASCHLSTGCWRRCRSWLPTSLRRASSAAAQTRPPLSLWPSTPRGCQASRQGGGRVAVAASGRTNVELCAARHAHKMSPAIGLVAYLLPGAGLGHEPRRAGRRPAHARSVCGHVHGAADPPPWCGRMSGCVVVLTSDPSRQLLPANPVSPALLMLRSSAAPHFQTRPLGRRRGGLRRTLAGCGATP